MQILVILVAAGVLFVAVRLLVPVISPQPENLGVSDDGQLAACPSSPNCVSTQANPDDNTHYIEPMRFDGSVEDARDAIVRIIESMPRSTIVTTESNYIHATFRSQMMGFIDDTEFYFDAAQNTIHFRSAARLGQGDMGVNRRRMETIREQFNG